MIRSTQSPTEIPPQNLLSAHRNRVLRRRAEDELHRVRRRTNAAIRELRQSLLEASREAANYAQQAGIDRGRWNGKG